MLHDGVYLVQVLSYDFVGSKKEAYLVELEILRPANYYGKKIAAFVTNSRIHRNAQIFIKRVRKGHTTLLVEIRRDREGTLWLNKPFIPVTVGEWDKLEQFANTAEKKLQELAEQYGATLQSDRYYNSLSFRVWYLCWYSYPKISLHITKFRKVIRVGCPFFKINRAFWISAYLVIYRTLYNEPLIIDLTEKTNKKVKAKIKPAPDLKPINIEYAPRMRIYHNNSNIPKKMFEVIKYYMHKLNFAEKYFIDEIRSKGVGILKYLNIIENDINRKFIETISYDLDLLY